MILIFVNRAFDLLPGYGLIDSWMTGSGLIHGIDVRLAVQWYYDGIIMNGSALIQTTVILDLLDLCWYITPRYWISEIYRSDTTWLVLHWYLTQWYNKGWLCNHTCHILMTTNSLLYATTYKTTIPDSVDFSGKNIYNTRISGFLLIYTTIIPESVDFCWYTLQ